nr:hypothetical protein CFP56_72037 [Quercus suber]
MAVVLSFSRSPPPGDIGRSGPLVITVMSRSSLPYDYVSVTPFFFNCSAEQDRHVEELEQIPAYYETSQRSDARRYPVLRGSQTRADCISMYCKRASVSVAHSKSRSCSRSDLPKSISRRVSHDCSETTTWNVDHRHPAFLKIAVESRFEMHLVIQNDIQAA